MGADFVAGRPVSAGCYVCGSLELAPGGNPGSATCAGCIPARDHVVSMQTGPGGVAAAVCPCGWRYESQFVGQAGSMFRDVAVLAHWRAMIAAANAEVQS